MSRYVFILGAGASKDCGAPLMAEFLEKSRELYRSFHGKFNPPFDKVAAAISALQVVHSKADLDIHGLEPVFGALEMGRILRKLPGVEDANAIDGVLQAFRTVIAETLEKLIRVPCDNNKVRPPNAYADFTRVLSAINEKAGSPVCSVITLNYDVLADFALFSRPRLGYDYGLGNGGGGQVPLLKLHGSLNWSRCSNVDCGKNHTLAHGAIHRGYRRVD